MPAYNFQRRFAERVRIGKIKTTIRPLRKRATVVGDTLYLFVGQRTKLCERLCEHACVRVERIDIHRGHIVLDGRLLSEGEACELAQADGFGSLADLCDWFEETYGLPIVGELEIIGWD